MSLITWGRDDENGSSSREYCEDSNYEPIIKHFKDEDKGIEENIIGD